MIWLIKMNVMFWFSTNDDIQLMIQLNFFFSKFLNQFDMIHHQKNLFDVHVKNRRYLFILILHIVYICLMKNFNVVFVNLFGRVFICKTNSHSWCFDKFDNVLLIIDSRILFIVFIKQSDDTLSQRRNCLCQTYAKSLCCFFNTLWNDGFDSRMFEKKISECWSKFFRKFAENNWWCHLI